MQRKLVILFMSCGLVGLLTTQASALPIVTTTSTQLDNGNWRYSYALENTGGDAIFDFGIYFFGMADAAFVGDPTGWSHLDPVGYDPASGWGFINWLSPMLDDGSTPYDLLAGSMLGGFVFESAFGPGPILFTINGVLADTGTTTGPNPVPEPGTLLLLGTGLATMIARRRRTRLSPDVQTICLCVPDPQETVAPFPADFLL